MDNLSHTLVGAALGKAGLQKRTPLATAALLIGANLPDVDVLAYAWGAETAVAVLSHPLLDWLNTYGMRWLMPFRGVWSYGDTLFIVDPWLWLALSIGV